MWRQIKLIMSVESKNLLGLNEARYSKDKKKSTNAKAMLVTYIFVIVMMVGYITALSSAYSTLGLTAVIPPYMFMTTALVCLMFTMLSAGDKLYNARNFVRLTAYPLRPAAIVYSRILSNYVTDLILSVLVMVPSTVIYAMSARPTFGVYVMIFLAIPLLPMIPIAIAAVLGLLIAWISGRMKRKSLVGIVLSMVFFIAIMAVSILPSFMGGEEAGVAELGNTSAQIVGQITKAYPPAALFAAGIVDGVIWKYVLFVVLSIAVFAAFCMILPVKYSAICTSLQSERASKNFVMSEQESTSILRSLYKKELRRYFASTPYVMNTAIGFVMMPLAAIALAVIGVDALTGVESMSGMLTMIPAVFAVMIGIANTTSVSISMEGKSWWIIKSLPVDTRTILMAKMLLNLTIAIPSYLVTATVLSFVLHDAQAIIWIWVLPLAFILFGTVLGISINLRFYKFDWPNETAAVKQGTPTLVMMLSGMFSGAVALILAIILFEHIDIAYGILTAVLAVLTVVFFKHNSRADLTAIN